MIDAQVFNLDDLRQKQSLLARLGAARGTFEVTVKPYKPRRSNRANSYYWAAVVKSFQEYEKAQGVSRTEDECHNILKALHHPEDFVDPVTGEVARIGKSTAGLDTAEFSDYVTRCIVWLSEMSVIVPPPELYTGRVTA